VVPIPEDLAFEQAAACPVAGLTAWFLVRDLALAPGRTAVVHAAAGGVGCFLGGLVRDAGAASIGLVSSDEKAEIARRAGHAHVVNYKREDPVTRVQELTGGRGADVVYDSVAGPGFARSFEMARVGGTVVLFGRAAGEPPPGVFESAFLGAGRNLGLRTYFLGATIQSDPLAIRPAYAALFDALRQGRVRLPLETLPLERAGEAHARLESGRSTGKFVLLPG
jgi:NADPH2:quinone reductase